VNVERLQFGNDLSENPDLMDLVPLLVENESFVAGGVFKDLFSDKAPKDIDVFFYNEAACDTAINKFLRSKKYELTYNTARSVGFVHTLSNTVVDIVRYQYGTPLEVISRFDFSICKMAFYKDEQGFSLVRDTRSMSDLKNKLLYVDSSITNPDLFFNRLLRYIDYGYTVDVNTKMQLFRGIREMDSLSLITHPSTKY
jgi:hypothetical protein